MNSLVQLTDASLHSETKRLVGAFNGLTAQLLAHLGEVEARGIHRERACSSLYAAQHLGGLRASSRRRGERTGSGARRRAGTTPGRGRGSVRCNELAGIV